MYKWEIKWTVYRETLWIQTNAKPEYILEDDGKMNKLLQ